MARPTPRSSISSANQSYSKGRAQSTPRNDYEEFASLQLDKPNEAELKTSEEMKKHMFDDHFEGRPIERAMHILAGGDEVQKISVIRGLAQLLTTDEEGCMQRVVPKIQQALNIATTEFHVEGARTYAAILQKKSVSPNTFAQNFLPSVILHADNRDQVAANAWMDTLLLATELLPLDIVKNNIFGIAISKGQISQTVTHRISSCKLLGKLCPRFDAYIVKKDILPVVLSLCQDVNEGVRACICSQLYAVAKSIPHEMVKSALIPILVELGRDEIIQVRVEATESIVKIIPLLSPELLKVSIIPLIKKICEQAILSVDETLVMVAKQYGSLCLGLEACLTHSEKLWLATYYHNLSHLGIPLHGGKKDVFYPSHTLDRINARYIECRQFCAYNFPAMAKFCSTSPELLEKIYPSLCDFSTDPFYMVRKTVGAGMHEVARILGKNNRIVKNQVITLLWDNMEEVLMGIVPNLSKTIECLIASDVLGHEQDAVSFELGRGLLQCDKTIRDKTHNWRLYSVFITQLETIVKCLPSDYIYSHFVALMFEKMHRARPLPCRLAAARTLLVFLRYNLKNNQRQEIRSRLQSEFCLSSSCYKRMLYLRLCITAREIFSRTYFKEHFFFPLLSRSEDKVANNRLLLIRQFPSLKAMIVMPSEKRYLQTLENVIRNMALAEKDKGVTSELRSLIYRLEKTETLLETNPNQTAEDIEDRRKLDEEMRLSTSGGRPAGNIPIAAADSHRVQRPEPKTQKPGESLRSSNPTSTPGSSISFASNSPRTERVSSYVTSSNHPVASSYNLSSTSHSSNVQSYNNPTNSLFSVRSSALFSANTTNINQKCTCYSTPYTRSESLRNLNLLALIDANFMYSPQQYSETLHQKLNQDSRLKLPKSSKQNMEISWLNLETDLKNELFALMQSCQIQGDRNYKEKSKFLTDFRNYNESHLSKFINEDHDYKETIYNVTGVGMSSLCEKNDSSFLEERINFFERKLKQEDGKTNNTNLRDCSCFELITNKLNLIEANESKKFSYFSKNFEDDFYRDAGVKANEVIGKKFSGIPIYYKPTMQSSLPKVTTSVLSKRKTWVGDENLSSNPVKLESITGCTVTSLEKKKSDTLPGKESVNLQKLGIGPRSKSFVLPTTSINASVKAENSQGIKNSFEKESIILKRESNSSGSIRLKTDSSPNRFGFRLKSRDDSLVKVDAKTDKSLVKTRIPVGRIINDASPASSRSASPISAKDKLEEHQKPLINNTKKIPVVVTRKSMVIQSSSIKSNLRNNRRSLDSAKITLVNLDRGGTFQKKSDKSTGKGKIYENGKLQNNQGLGQEKGEADITNNSGFSKLPIRRSKLDK